MTNINHLHEKLSSLVGAGSSMILGESILDRIIVGVTVGVSVWCITRGISFVVRRLAKRYFKNV